MNWRLLAAAGARSLAGGVSVDSRMVRLVGELKMARALGGLAVTLGFREKSWLPSFFVVSSLESRFVQKSVAKEKERTFAAT